MQDLQRQQPRGIHLMLENPDRLLPLGAFLHLLRIQQGYELLQPLLIAQSLQ
jgi:hypothetical protein